MDAGAISRAHGRSCLQALAGKIRIPMRADVDLDIGRKTFTSGLLPELISVLRRSRPGDLVAVVGDEASIGPELETWCRFTGNALLETTVENGRKRWVFRYGAVAVPAGVAKEDNRPGRLAALALHEFRL